MEKAALKYWLITRSALTATDADRKCFVTTAGCAGATKQRDKMCLWSTAGTPKPPGQAPPDTLKNFDASKFLHADHPR